MCQLYFQFYFRLNFCIKANTNSVILNQKEKMIMTFFYDSCLNKATKLFRAEEIVEYVSKKKNMLSLGELDNIMNFLQKENYIDYVASESKKGTIYCVSLKQKGQIFKKDLQVEKRKTYALILRTVALAILSFIVGLILNAIF